MVRTDTELAATWNMRACSLVVVSLFMTSERGRCACLHREGSQVDRVIVFRIKIFLWNGVELASIGRPPGEFQERRNHLHPSLPAPPPHLLRHCIAPIWLIRLLSPSLRAQQDQERQRDEIPPDSIIWYQWRWQQILYIMKLERNGGNRVKNDTAEGTTCTIIIHDSQTMELTNFPPLATTGRTRSDAYSLGNGQPLFTVPSINADHFLGAFLAMNHHYMVTRLHPHYHIAITLFHSYLN